MFTLLSLKKAAESVETLNRVHPHRLTASRFSGFVSEGFSLAFFKKVWHRGVSLQQHEYNWSVQPGAWIILRLTFI